MKTVKRILAAVLTALALVCLCACSSGTKDIDVAAAADRLNSEVTFADMMSGVDADMCARILGLDEGVCESAAGYISTGATAEELFVLKAASGKTADVKAAADKRIASQKESYADYAPGEVPKLESAVIETRGQYIFIVVCDEAASAKNVINAIAG